MKFSKRMDLFGESIFTTLANMRSERKKQGLEVIDLSIGAPNIPPTQEVMETIAKEAMKPENYLYAIKDAVDFQNTVKEWYEKRYGVTIDPETEMTSLLGSQDGLAHLALTLVDEGNIVLVQDPCYPIFRDGPLLAGAKVVTMPLLKENDYLIDFDMIDEKTDK